MNDSNIIEYLKGVIHSLTDVAIEQNVILIFVSTLRNLNTSYDKDVIRSHLVKFLLLLIKYTPSRQKVSVFFDELHQLNQNFKLVIIITGIDLTRVTELTLSSQLKIDTKCLTDHSTIFTLEIPLKINHYENKSAQRYERIRSMPYYLEINNRLTSHFSKIENFINHNAHKSSEEGKFLKRVNLIVTTYLHNNEFSVEKLSLAMAMSRTQLYRKVKLLTEMSPIQYILLIRLQTAKELLSVSALELNISEVSYKVGFISNSHFSRAFKKQFGVNPSIYRSENSESNM